MSHVRLQPHYVADWFATRPTTDSGVFDLFRPSSAGASEVSVAPGRSWNLGLKRIGLTWLLLKDSKIRWSTTKKQCQRNSVIMGPGRLRRERPETPGRARGECLAHPTSADLGGDVPDHRIRPNRPDRFVSRRHSLSYVPGSTYLSTHPHPVLLFPSRLRLSPGTPVSSRPGKGGVQVSGEERARTGDAHRPPTSVLRSAFRVDLTGLFFLDSQVSEPLIRWQL